MASHIQKIFMLPYTLKDNPYMERLRESIESIPLELTERSFKVLPFSYRAYVIAAMCGERPIAHIHMETNVYGSAYAVISIVRMSVRFSLLFLARAFGARVVWTLHNLSAHDYPHPTIDTFGKNCMWRLADTVIVQNQNVIPKLAVQHPRARIIYIPHANFTGIYGSPVSRAAARTELAIPEDARVLMCLGSIRPYKRLEVIIDAVNAATREENSKLLLLIAGKGGREYTEQLLTRAHDSQSIRIVPGFVPDSRIPVFLGAADYAVFAYADSSLTSGALLLALSYDVPVITENMPAAELIHEAVNGYVAEDDAALVELIVGYDKLANPPAGAALASVVDFTWERVGKETRAVYALCIGL